MRQFGVFVTKEKYQNAGIGIQLNYGKAKDSMGFILPNKLLTEMEFDTNIAGFYLKTDFLEHQNTWLHSMNSIRFITVQDSAA